MTRFPLLQAFLAAIVVLVALRYFEADEDFGWVMWHGGGTWLPIAAFLGVIAYHLGRQYLQRR